MKTAIEMLEEHEPTSFDEIPAIMDEYAKQFRIYITDIDSKSDQKSVRLPDTYFIDKRNHLSMGTEQLHLSFSKLDQFGGCIATITEGGSLLSKWMNKEEAIETIDYLKKTFNLK